MTKKKQLLSVFCLATALTVSLTAGIVGVTYANSSQGWSENTVETEYRYKETIVLEDRTYTVGGDSVVADVVVCYPDGSSTFNKQILLDQAGIYKVNYAAEIDGKVYAEERQFLVNYPAYSVANEKSSIDYGTPDRASNPGVIARIAQGDKLVFTQYIDFTKITSDDFLVKGYVTPDVVGSAEISELVMTFTDSEDPSIFFEVHHYAHDYTWSTSVAANGQNQAPAGIHQSEGLHKDDTFGLWSHLPFSSMDNTGIVAPDNTQFFVKMDYANKQIFGQGYINTTAMVIDLDDLSMMDSVWTGFPSGKARLSIGANGYTGATANLCITEVMGIDNLANNVYLDTDKPTVTIAEGFEEMPLAAVGHDYAIPSATAYDAYAYDCDVDVRVWYNYGMENCTNVAVKNGAFTVDKVGTYAIEYIAQDRIGNTTSIFKPIRALVNVEEATFAIPEDKATSAVAGEWIVVPTISSEEVSGGCGKVVVKAYAEIGGERTPIEKGGFRAMQTGTYKVVYVATDYVGIEAERSYEVTVSAGEVPVLERNFDVYPAYLSGQSYALPAYAAYHYENGVLERKDCEVVVSDANGTKTYVAGERFVPMVAAQGDPIRFEVKYAGETLATHESVGVLGLINRRLHVENYLVGGGFTVEKTSKGMVLTADGDAPIAFTFANRVSANQVALSFDSAAGVDADTTLKITLRDSLDKNVSLCIELGKDGADTYFKVGDVRKTVAALAFDGGELAISYKNGKFAVGDQSMEVSGFDGFDSGEVFVSVAYEGFTAGSIRFVSFGNANFNSGRTDRITPILYTEQETGGTWLPGTEYTLTAPIAYDVYSPNVIYTLNVTAPDGTPAVAKDGTVMQNADPRRDYVITLSQIGKYQVNYTISESKEFIEEEGDRNPVSLQYALWIADKVAPKIVWKSAFVTEAKVGDMWIVPDYTVSDNYDSAEKITVRFFVETPLHQLILLPGNSIQVTQVGEYQIRVMVSDESGNLINETHVVNVVNK